MSDLPFNLVDGVVIALVVMSALFAFFRGFTREVLSIAAWVGAALVALYLQDNVKPYALQATGHEVLAQAIAVGAPFIVALLVFSILTHLVASRVQQSAVGPLDRTLGFAFGILRGLAVVSIFYLVVTNLVKEPEDPAWMRDAKTLPIIRAGAEIVFDILPPELRSDQVLSRLRDEGGVVLDGARTFETIAPVLSPNAPGGPAPTPAPPPGPQGALPGNGETSYSTQQVSDFNRLIDSVGTTKAN
ncbi:CvpA family protein [Zavarzinia aquatilis]|uniref:Colicin V production protein n=1 Tax=Zavarzinia aquatilis TaxID=2211142 RepID=A0A317EI23_9PROT|nr:CvpA family protein [Zavarzinia aquatilis]PWR24875.1 colicin V production protein [Zavarzinia aquatilis]